MSLAVVAARAKIAVLDTWVHAPFCAFREFPGLSGVRFYVEERIRTVVAYFVPDVVCVSREVVVDLVVNAYGLRCEAVFVVDQCP